MSMLRIINHKHKSPEIYIPIWIKHVAASGEKRTTPDERGDRQSGKTHIYLYGNTRNVFLC